MKKNAFLPYLLISPVSLFLGVFFIYPFVLVSQQAFQTDVGFGLENFYEVFSHWKFGISLRNTLLLAIIVVPLQTVVSLLMAVLINKAGKMRNIVLYIWTIPLGISDLAAGIIWLAIFEQSGFLNSMLSSLNLVSQAEPLISYQNPVVVFVAIALTELWRATAIMLVIIVAGIGLIPKEYNEAAEIFGAGSWQRFWKVTLPLLKPSLQTALILRTIMAFEVFGVVLTLAGTLMPVLMSETYEYQFALNNNQAASAIALVILLISIGFTLIFLRLLKTPKSAQI